MDRLIIWTELDSSDIETIVRYTARRNPRAAAAIGLGLYRRAQILVTHPEAGSPLNELCKSEWRKLVFRRWKIIYRISGVEIVIGRVWPAAMGEIEFEEPLPSEEHEQ